MPIGGAAIAKDFRVAAAGARVPQAQKPLPPLSTGAERTKTALANIIRLDSQLSRSASLDVDEQEILARDSDAAIKHYLLAAIHQNNPEYGKELSVKIYEAGGINNVSMDAFVGGRAARPGPECARSCPFVPQFARTYSTQKRWNLFGWQTSSRDDGDHRQRI